MPSRSARPASVRRGQLRVQAHTATQQAPVRAQPAEHDLRVGRGRLRAAEAVARRPGVSFRGLRAHAEDPAFVDVRDRSAASTDRVDVDHGDHRLVVADLGFEQVAHPQLAACRHTHVG
jgi:hypothetical protein